MAKVLFGVCPNGYSFTIPCLLTLVAIILSVVASFSCHFFRSDSGVFVQNRGIVDFGNNKPQQNDTEFNVGLFTLQEIDDDGETGSCVLWDRDALDRELRTARSASVITLGFSALFLVSFCLISVWRINKACLRIFFKFSGCTFCLVGMLMVLTLVVLLSDFCRDAEDCILLRAGYLACVSSLFWVVAGFLLCCCTHVNHRERKERAPKQVEDDDDDDDGKGEEQDEEIVETDVDEEASTTFVETSDKTESDGTVVRITKTTVTHRNGRKTVTQKREIVSVPVPPPAPEDDTQSTTFVDVDNKTESDGTVVKITTTTVTHRSGRKSVTQEREVISKPPPPPPPATTMPKKKKEDEVVENNVEDDEVLEKEEDKPQEKSELVPRNHPDPPGERSSEIRVESMASRQLSEKVQQNNGVLGACSPALWCG